MTEPTEEEPTVFEEELTDEEIATNRSAVFAAYGSVMLDFQMLDLDLWALLAQIPDFPEVRKAAADNLDTFMEWIEKKPTGPLTRPLKGTMDLELFEELTGAVRCRNHLAHEFLRLFAIHPANEANRDAAVAELAGYQARLALLTEQLVNLLPDVEESGLDPELLA
ncbi:MAG: hypothetical protein ACYCW6_31170, partial [Candidatus Xenobia bacterium]